MTRASKSRRPLSVAHLLAVVGIGLAVVMIGAFNRRLAAGQRVLESQRVLQTQVAILEDEQQLLQTQVAYATTDAAVIEWAHAEGKQVQPGEVLVVPIPGTPPVTPSDLAPEAPAPAPGNWELWWILFFAPSP